MYLNFNIYCQSDLAEVSYPAIQAGDPSLGTADIVLAIQIPGTLVMAYMVGYMGYNDTYIMGYGSWFMAYIAVMTHGSWIA